MMRKLPSGMLVIEAEPDGKCELCGKMDELRPYGPNRERICFDCGMKNKELTQQRVDEIFDGPPTRSDA